MKFIKIYAVTLILCFLFISFGGWMLFDFNERWFVAIAACSLVIAALVSGFMAMDDKIEKLEDRVKQLEEKE